MRIAIIHLTPNHYQKEKMNLALSRAEIVSVDLDPMRAAHNLDDYTGIIVVGNLTGDSAQLNSISSECLASLKAQSVLGKPILGIASGACLLAAIGLVPGIADYGVGVRFADYLPSEAQLVPEPLFIRLSPDHQYNAFTRCLAPNAVSEISNAVNLPAMIIPPGLLAEMRIQGLNLFQYCNAAGAILDVFPVNPNGSVENTAAVSNKAGNVLAMVPDIVGSTLGDAIFQSMRSYHEKGYVERVMPLHYLPRE